MSSAGVGDNIAELPELDRFLLYQEQMRRAEEGDEIDVQDYAKAQLTLTGLSQQASSCLLALSHEDHTLGNALRHVLMGMQVGTTWPVRPGGAGAPGEEDSEQKQGAEPFQTSVITAGYSIPHPLEPRMLVHLTSEDYAPRAISLALHRLADIADQIAAEFDEKVPPEGEAPRHPAFEIVPFGSEDW